MGDDVRSANRKDRTRVDGGKSAVQYSDLGNDVVKSPKEFDVPTRLPIRNVS